MLRMVAICLQCSLQQVFTLPAQAAQSIAAAHPIDAAWLRKRRSRIHLQRLLIKQQLVAEHHMTTMARWFSVVSGQPAIVLLQDPFAWKPGDPADGALCVVHASVCPYAHALNPTQRKPRPSPNL